MVHLLKKPLTLLVLIIRMVYEFIFIVAVMRVQLRYFLTQAEVEEAVLYLALADKEELKTTIMDMMEVSAPEAAAEREE